MLSTNCKKKLRVFQKMLKQMVVLTISLLSQCTYICAAYILSFRLHITFFFNSLIFCHQSVYWVLLVKICWRQIRIWKHLIKVNQFYRIVSGFALWVPYLLSPNRNNTPSDRTSFRYFLPHLDGTTDHMISIDTVETNELIGTTSVVPNSSQKTCTTVL